MVGAAIKPPGSVDASRPQKPRPQRRSAKARAPRRTGRPAPIVRIAISVCIVWHFTGVFLAALSMPTTFAAGHEHRAEAADAVVSRRPVFESRSFVLRTGCRARAHRFATSCSIRAISVIEQGQAAQTGKNIGRGCCYHRHFMLADQADMPSDDKQLATTGSECISKRTPDSCCATTQKLKRCACSGMHIGRCRHRTWLMAERRGYEQLTRNSAQQGRTRRVDEQGYEMLMEVTQRRSDLGPEAGDQTQTLRSLSRTRPNWQMIAPSRWTGGSRDDRRHAKLLGRSLGSVERVLVLAHQPVHALGDPRAGRRDAAVHAPGLVVRISTPSSARTAGCRSN